jgi:hypothetical protein
MRTFSKREYANQNTGSKSIYADVWPYRPGQKRPNYINFEFTSVPFIKYPENQPEELIDYHGKIVSYQRYFNVPFNDTRIKFEEERLRKTLNWGWAGTQRNLDFLKQLAKGAKNYFRYEVYDADRPYYDYVGRTLLH